MTRTTLLWCLWAAVMAAGAVWSLVPPAPARRLRPRQPGAWGEALPAWLRARPDAWPAGRRWLAGAAVGLAVVIGGYGFGPVIAGVGAVAAGATAVALGRLESGRQRVDQAWLRQQAPSGLEAMAACLDAGLPLRQATAVVGELSPAPLSTRLRRVVTGVDVGLADADAWLGLADDPVLGGVARDVARAADWGTTVSALLCEAAAELRRQAEAEAKTRARAVGVRTVLPLSLCYLPAFLLLGIVPVFGSGFLAVFFGP
jgi:pilus assembly protein TadC